MNQTKCNKLILFSAILELLSSAAFFVFALLFILTMFNSSSRIVIVVVSFPFYTNSFFIKLCLIAICAGIGFFSYVASKNKISLYKGNQKQLSNLKEHLSRWKIYSFAILCMLGVLIYFLISAQNLLLISIFGALAFIHLLVLILVTIFKAKNKN